VMLLLRARSFVRQYVSVSASWRDRASVGKAADLLKRSSFSQLHFVYVPKSQPFVLRCPVTVPYVMLNCMVFPLFVW